MNGITYYRLKSDYTGDYTKNCALNGTEVDNNFYVLEGRDVKSIAVNGKDIVVTLMNGDNLTAYGALDFGNSIVNVEFDKLNGILKLTNADGTIQYIEGFTTNENTNMSVATDNTLCGDGLRNTPLGVAPLARTGQYKSVKSIINVAEGGHLPNCGNLPGDRYITCEDTSDYGYLYDYRAVHEIACELRKTGWRIPTKQDWDDLLNAIEPCDCDKTHNKADKNRFLGKWAGKLLKTKTMWKECCCDSCDSCGGCDCDCDECNKKKHNCGCEESCVCGDDVCFDYSDDPCVKTNECGKEDKCGKKECSEHRGLDAYGFHITPAGYADDGCNFGYFRERSAFWTATTDQNKTKAFIKRFQYNKDGVYQDVVASNYHFSLRLIKDYNGKNFHEVEEIMDMEYPTLLLPSVSKGHAIWTSCNFACGNASLNPMLPNNGEGLTFTRHYFINEWNGFKWVRNEMKEGDSVVVAKAPKGKKMIEYRIVDNEIVNVNDTVYEEVLEEIKPIIDDIIADEKAIKEELGKVEERVENVETRVENAETRIENAENRIENAETRLNADEERIANTETRVANAETRIENAETRLNVDEERITNTEIRIANAEVRLDTDEERIANAETRIENAETRLNVDEERIANIETRIENAETRIGNAEVRLDTDEERIANAETRIENAETRIANAETRIANAETRLDADEERIANAETRIENAEQAIIKEVEERKEADEVIEGKLLTEEGTEYNPETGELTLKSAAGTNDIKVQFSFNFGEF